jgi:hypothetical protein
MKLIFSFLILFFWVQSLGLAQTHLSGKVLDEKNEPLPGVNVFLKGTFDGASTDQSGSFQFETSESEILAFFLTSDMTQAITPTDCRDDRGVWRDLKKFLLVNLAIALFLQLVFCPICFLSLKDLKGLLPDFIFSFCVSMALSYGGSRVEEFWDKRISWVHDPVKRLLTTVSTYMVYAFVVSFIIVFCYAWIEWRFPSDQIPWRGILKFTFTPMTIALVFMAIFTSRSWLIEWRKSAIEAEHLRFRMDTPNPNRYFLPPLSLQLLLENAIKHNIASQENPLFISIFQKDDELWVSNTLQPKTSQNEPSTGVGLENIRARYRILSDQTPEIFQSEHEFLVKLPLLKVNA